MLRELGGFEAALSLSHEEARQTFVIVVQLSAAPDPVRLQNALDALQSQHPLLDVHIERRGGRYFFASGSAGPIPLHTVRRKGEGDWVAVAEAELHRHIRAGEGPLLEATLLRPEGGWGLGELVLTWHHAIIDGDSAASFLDELLALTSRSGEGHEGSRVGAYKLLPAAHDLFPPAFRGSRFRLRSLPFLARTMADEASYLFGTRGTRVPPIHPDAKCKVLLKRIDPETTAALIRTIRAQGVTLNSALSAAMLHAIWTSLYSSEPRPLRGISFANLRPYLKPPVPGGNLGCYISMLRYTIRMQPGQDFWDTARGVHERIYRAAKRGDKYLMARMSPYVMRMTFRTRAFRMATIGLSYAGPVQIEPQYGEATVLGVHAFVSNFGVGPELTGTVTLSDGELQWDMLYLDTDMSREEAQAIADDMLGILRRAAAKSI